MFFYNKERLKKAAEKNVAQGNLEKAISQYEKILNKEPAETDILGVLGELKIKTGQQEEGLSLLRKAAEIYSNEGQHNKAITILKKCVRFDPENEEYLKELTDLYIQSDKKENAVDALLQTGKLVEKKEPGSAIYYYEKALKFDPNNVDALAALGELYSKQKLTQKALEYNFNAGKKLYEKGDFARSYIHLYEVIQQEPDNREANMLILKVLIKLKSYEDALLHLNGMLPQGKENDPELLRLKAELLFELQNKEELKNVLNKLSILETSAHSTVFEFAEKAIEKKNYNFAVEIINLLEISQFHSFSSKLSETLEKILTEAPNNAMALQKKAEFKIFIGDLYEVKTIYSKLYNIYLEKNEFQKANQLLTKWLNLDEDNQWLRQEKRRLELILEEQFKENTDLIRGKIEDISLPDVVQMLESARKTGALKVQYADRTGKIYFRAGKIIHADFYQWEGMDAIIKLFKLKGGNFTFEVELPSHIPETIKGSNTQVVLEAMRIIDEETHNLKKDSEITEE